MFLSDAKVLSHTRLKGAYFFLRLEAPEIAAEAAPGQFVHLRVPALEPTALRRPFSICGADPRDGSLEILYKQVGRGTRAMESLKPGDIVNLMGPLGNAFPMPRENEKPLLIAGGFGVAPLLFLAKQIKGQRLRVNGQKIVLFVGGRSADDILLVEEFQKIGVETVVCTDDGSVGEKGFVTLALDKFFAASSDATVLYCCGPEPLLKAVDERAQARACDAWLSLDRRMACAVGACLGCVVDIKTPNGAISRARVCKDGPVFGAGTVVW